MSKRPRSGTGKKAGGRRAAAGGKATSLAVIKMRKMYDGPRNMRAMQSFIARGPEVKYLDVPSQAVGDPATWIFSSTGVIGLLNGLSVGTAAYQRNGKRIHSKSLHITGQIVSSGQVPTGAAEYLRFLIIYDKQPNTTNMGFPAVADIFGDLDYASNITSNSYSKINPQNAERFQVLRDIRIAIPLNDPGAALDRFNAVIDYTTNRVNINEFIKLKDLRTEYKVSSSAPPAIGDVITGALYAVALGNLPLGGPSFPGYAVTFNSRLRFLDV